MLLCVNLEAVSASDRTCSCCAQELHSRCVSVRVYRGTRVLQDKEGMHAPVRVIFSSWESRGSLTFATIALEWAMILTACAWGEKK